MKQLATQALIVARLWVMFISSASNKDATDVANCFSGTLSEGPFAGVGQPSSELVSTVAEGVAIHSDSASCKLVGNVSEFAAIEEDVRSVANLSNHDVSDDRIPTRSTLAAEEH